MSFTKSLAGSHTFFGYRRAGGFSLVELMVTLAVVAILAAVATPSLVSVVNNNRLAAQSNEMVASLQIARSEAVRMNAQVSLCRSTNGTSCAAAGPWTRWIVVSGTQVLRDSSVRPPVQIASGAATVTFRPDGLSRDAAGGLTNNSFTVCIPTNTPPANQRVVALVRGNTVTTTVAGTGAGTC
jgi:type IV fimbrial biogenesis protein FimT